MLAWYLGHSLLVEGMPAAAVSYSNPVSYVACHLLGVTCDALRADGTQGFRSNCSPCCLTAYFAVCPSEAHPRLLYVRSKFRSPARLKQQGFEMDDDERPMGLGLGMNPAQVVDPKLAAGRGAEFSAGALVGSSSISSCCSSSKAGGSAPLFMLLYLLKAVAAQFTSTLWLM